MAAQAAEDPARVVEALRARIAENMRRLRRLRKLTVEEAAKAGGVPVLLWQAAEEGKSEQLMVSMLVGIAWAPDVRVTELLRSLPGSGGR